MAKDKGKDAGGFHVGKRHDDPKHRKGTWDSTREDEAKGADAKSVRKAGGFKTGKHGNPNPPKNLGGKGKGSR